jgi:hypothetical protein
MSTQQLDILLKALTLLTVAITAYLAVRRFGLQRESATCLRVLVTAKVVLKSNEMSLIAVTVNLDNLGQTRIDARTKPRDSNGYLYDDGWDRLEHAGTLKIRPIARAKEPIVFDWYSLPSLPIATMLSANSESYGHVIRQNGDLEQINYLDDYQNPEDNFAEVHFWLEPKESYELLVDLWLPPGTYAAKAVFLGKKTSHEDEEYWSHVCTFNAGSNHINDT